MCALRRPAQPAHPHSWSESSLSAWKCFVSLASHLVILQNYMRSLSELRSARACAQSDQSSQSTVITKDRKHFLPDSKDFDQPALMCRLIWVLRCAPALMQSVDLKTIFNTDLLIIVYTGENSGTNMSQTFHGIKNSYRKSVSISECRRLIINVYGWARHGPICGYLVFWFQITIEPFALFQYRVCDTI